MKLLFILITICLATNVFGYRDSNWGQFNKADKQEIIKFRVALQQQNLDVLESTLLDVSNPKSENYGKHWDMDSVLDLVSPDPSISNMVVEYLIENGCYTAENKRDSIKVTASVEIVEKLFAVTMYNYKHNNVANQAIIRSTQTYSVPREISKYVHIVTGISELPHLKKPRGKRVTVNLDGATASDPGMIVPQTLQQLYNIPVGFTNDKNTSVCAAEFQSDRSYNPKDLGTFSSKTGTPLIAVTHNVGTFEPTNPDTESTLDVQYAGSTAQSAQVWFWTVDGWMYEFSSDLAATNPAPFVVSMSWGWPEPSQCQNGIGNCPNGETSQQYVDRCNIEFQKSGLRGITLLASSGDQGAPGDGNPSCSGKTRAPLSTIFPGASPWVTSVGATMLAAPSANEPNPIDTSSAPVCQTHKCATSTSEVVCSYPSALITTGGGFSAYSPLPDWQADVVNAYLKSGAKFPDQKYFNASNRAFPDVSGLGHNYYTVVGDQMTIVDGTSCSSPVVGGIVALLNSYRFSVGKSSMGFINPVLYAAAASNYNAFSDITVGNNLCTESCCSKFGFVAAKGYDAATGLGTPKVDGLLKYVATLN